MFLVINRGRTILFEIIISTTGIISSDDEAVLIFLRKNLN